MSNAETVDGLTFAEWKARVNLLAGAKLGGLTTDDLPDAAYWDSWHSGMTPAEMLREVLEAEGYGDLMDDDDE